VVKLISEVPTVPAAQMDATQKQAVTQMMRGLEGAIIGENTDAPKIYGFGIARHQGKSYYYVEMEQAFPGQKPTILKNVLDSGQGASLIHPKDGVSPLPSMAKHFVDAFSKQIGPSDGDFIIGAKGEVRWIDPFAWKNRLWKNTNSNNPDRGKTGSTFTHFMYRFTQNSPESAKVFFHHFLKELKNDPSMSDFEKHLLLEELFLSQHQNEQATRRRLRDYMKKIEVVSGDTSEPLANVLKIYNALP
jgi:hypothetical protein